MTSHEFAGRHYTTTGTRTPRFDPRDWHPGMACRADGVDVNVFVPGDNERGPNKKRRVAKAKAICDGCPFVADCCAWAVANPDVAGEWAIYGSTTPEERDAIRQRPAPSATVAVTPGRDPAVYDRLEPCPSTSARRRHLAQGQTCQTCGVGHEPLPDAARTEAA